MCILRVEGETMEDNKRAKNMESRRYGAELEDALLAAAEQELNAVGYNGLTMKGVAARAKTSRSVLNRRWHTRLELVLAVLRRRGLITTEPPNTGHLRTDVLALMNWFVSQVAVIGKDVILGMLSDTASGSEPSFDLQSDIHESIANWMSAIMEQAGTRGEARSEIPSIVLTLPIDLLRSELLIRRDPVTQDFLERVVDEIFLPLVSI
jgi:AcrR family transcriptional regulator